MATQQTRERVDARLAFDRKRIRRPPLSGFLCRDEERVVHQRLMSTSPPSPCAVGKLSEVEAILKHRSDGVFGEEVASAVPGRPVAALIEQHGHLPVRATL